MTTPDPEQNAREVLARQYGCAPDDAAFELAMMVKGPAPTIAAMLEYAALTTPTPRQEEAVAVPAGMVPLQRSREWWLARVDAEPDVPIGAGSPSAPVEITYNPVYDVTYVGADPTRGYVYRLTPDTAPLSGEDAPDFALTHPEVYDMASGEGRKPYPTDAMLAAGVREMRVSTHADRGVALDVWNAMQSAASLAQPRQTDETVERLREAAQALLDFIGTGGMRVYNDDKAVRDLAAALATPADDGEQRG